MRGKPADHTPDQAAELLKRMAALIGESAPTGDGSTGVQVTAVGGVVEGSVGEGVNEDDGSDQDSSYEEEA